MSDQPQPQQASIPLHLIRVSPDFNPRKVFVEADIDAFAERLRDSGWISPLLVRPDPRGGDGYLLVAGERRLRAVTRLGLATVPATIKEMDDVAHRALALRENADRSDLSVAEEAIAARDHVAGYGGDHAQAAASLGWTVARLHHRLRLLHCTPAVIDALLAEAIQIGHAELLATLPAENQEKALPRIIKDQKSVTQLREELNGFATSLATAIFPKDECAACPFNSECQGALFETHIDKGRCTNKGCFESKTAQALIDQRQELQGEYGSVALASERVPGTTTPLIKFGDQGVGAAQFDACRTCQLRGAIINDSPGANFGVVQAPMCFNLSCHSEKVADYAALKRTNDHDASGAHLPNSNDNSSGDGHGMESGTTRSPSINTSGAERTAKPQTTLKSVQDQYASVVRRAAVANMSRAGSTDRLALAAYSVLRMVAGELSTLTFTQVCKELGVEWSESESSQLGSTRLILRLAKRTDAELNSLIDAATNLLFQQEPDSAHSNGKINRRCLTAALVVERSLDTQPFANFDDAYFQAHTRSAIQHLLEESGFTAWMQGQDDGKKRYAAILAQSKSDCIKSILAAGFDFSAYQPADFKPQVKRWAEHRT